MSGCASAHHSDGSSLSLRLEAAQTSFRTEVARKVAQPNARHRSGSHFRECPLLVKAVTWPRASTAAQDCLLPFGFGRRMSAGADT